MAAIMAAAAVVALLWLREGVQEEVPAAGEEADADPDTGSEQTALA